MLKPHYYLYIYIFLCVNFTHSLQRSLNVIFRSGYFTYAAYKISYRQHLIYMLTFIPKTFSKQDPPALYSLPEVSCVVVVLDLQFRRVLILNNLANAFRNLLHLKA